MKSDFGEDFLDFDVIFFLPFCIFYKILLEVAVCGHCSIINGK
jgi:hypothetical protein